MRKYRVHNATFIEYAMLVGLVAIVVALAAYFFGDKLKALFQESGVKTQQVTDKVKDADFSKAPPQTK